MNKYLDLTTVQSYLNLGKTMEVFLGRISEDKEVISYIDLKRTESGEFEINHYELFDEGGLEFVDLYSFSSFDPDMGFETHTFDSIDLVIEFIHDISKLNEIKFLNAGLIQDEYKKLLISEGRS